MKEYIVEDMTGEIEDKYYPELIRCKDCKYYLKSNEECGLIKTRLRFYEEDKWWAEDSFCAWAERKEE